MPIPYLGDFVEDATVYIMFNTFTSDDPSASSTITNFINTDVHIHKDDGLTQRNNAAGITVSVNFDGITGSHMIKIDTSDDTVAAFWVTGSDYFVRIEGTTVDAATINAVVGHFSIENRFQEVDVVKWLGTAAATPTVAGVPEVDMTHLGGVAQSATDLKDFADAGYDPGTNKVQGVVLVDTTTTNTDVRGTDSAALASVVGALADATAAGDPTEADTLMQYTKQLINILIGTSGIAAFPAEAAPANAVSLAEVIRAIHADVTGLNGSAMIGTNSAALASVCTEARLAELAAANLPTDLTDIKGGTFSGATDSLEAIRNRGDAAWITGAGGSDRLLMVDTTIATLATQTSFTLTAGSVDDDAYNNCTIVIEDVSTATQKAVGLVSDYTGATKTITLDYDPGVFTMAATDKVYILADNSIKSTLSKYIKLILALIQ